MHDGMSFDPIQGQGQGHELLKVGKSPFSKPIISAIFSRSLKMTTDPETREQYLKMLRSRFLNFVLVFEFCFLELCNFSIFERHVLSHISSVVGNDR